MRRRQLLLAGFPKCGSSSVFDLLARHPAVAPSFRKETWVLYPPIWDRRPASDAELRAVESVCAASTGCVAVEGSPCTVFASKALIHQLASRSTATRVLVVIRDPVDRLRSAFEFGVSLGAFDPATRISTFVRWNVEGFARRPHFRPGVAPSFHLWSSDFAAHLEPWVQQFGSDLAIARTPDFEHLTARRELASWLDIEPEGFGELATLNATRLPGGSRASNTATAHELLPDDPGLASELDDIANDIMARTSALIEHSAMTTFGTR